jgi:hypothetical protein
VQNAAFAGARASINDGAASGPKPRLASASINDRAARGLASASLAVIIALIAGGAVGCDGCRGCSSGPSAATSVTAGAGKVVDHGEQPLIRALDALELRPDQSARVRAVKEALEAQNKAVKESRSALALALADAVRKNNIDRDALAPRIAAIRDAARATHTGMQRAFDDLHRTLDAGQRKALLASMKHELGQRSNAGRGEGRFRMDEVGTEIGLAPDQISAIRAKVKEHIEKLPPPEGAHDHRPIGQQLRAFTIAFESDTFDGSSFELGGGDPGVIAERGAELLIASTEVTLPELTPDQRTKLADKFVERAHKQE